MNDPDELRIRMAESIGGKRTRLKLSIRQLAKMSSVDANTIKKIERSSPYHPKYTNPGKWLPSLTVLILLADVLQIDLIDIMFRREFL